MIGFLLRLSIVRDKLKELLVKMVLSFCSVKPQNGTVFSHTETVVICSSLLLHSKKGSGLKTRGNLIQRSL